MLRYTCGPAQAPKAHPVRNSPIRNHATFINQTSKKVPDPTFHFPLSTFHFSLFTFHFPLHSYSHSHSHSQLSTFHFSLSMSKKPSPPEPKAPRSIVNRRARYDYEFLSQYEAGIALEGSEVKSVFLGRVNMADSYCQIKGDELWVINLDIEPYSHATHYQPERRRDRKLLMHRKEIDLLQRRSQEKGLAIIPSAMYFKNGRVKLEVALARGKRQYDKREKIAKEEQKREADRVRAMKLR